MPLYEFYCPPCGVQFEVLRPMSKMDEPAICPTGHETHDRVVSLFATLTKNAEGQYEVSPAAGGGCACGGSCGCN